MNLSHPAWRRKPLHTACRFAVSLIRRHFAGLRQAVVGYDEGRSKIVADLGTALGLHLYRYGHHDPDVELVRHLLHPGDVFVDGGANVGLFSLVAAARVGPNGKVIAFEPAQSTRARLAANVALNAFYWVEVRPHALAGGPGNVEFVAFEGNGAGLSSFAPASAWGGRTETVVTVALNDVIAFKDRERLALVKLDLEGAEFHALQGAAELLAATSDVAPDLLIEIEPEHLARQGASPGNIRDLLVRAGYQLFQTDWNETPQQNKRVILIPQEDPSGAAGRPNWYATKNPARAERAGVLFAAAPCQAPSATTNGQQIQTS